jgi:ribosome biogenesis GTPase
MTTGIVFRKSQGVYMVQTGQQIVQCEITSKLRKNLEQWGGISQSTNIRREIKAVHDIKQVDPVAIGDQVTYTETATGGMIMDVLPRRNWLSRRAAGDKPLEQVIVANLDQVVAVMAARKPDPKWALLDRYLAAAESAGVPALICITKMDLVDDDLELNEIMNLYRQLGYQVVASSSESGDGIDVVREALCGKVSVMIGKSGVGKSSLLNAIEPGLGLRVNEVSQLTEKGKHTTTHLEMFPLENGGAIVDTPGMREFGLWYEDIEGGLAYLFPEMRPYVGTCRFGLDCKHANEPGCAIKHAVDEGTIAPHRYESYLKLLDE